MEKISDLLGGDNDSLNEKIKSLLWSGMPTA